MSKCLRILLGPTGVGKTAVGVLRAKEIGCPILSCDSRQIYREMVIGTAAPSFEEREGVPHYFIGSHSIQNLYTAGNYELEALELISRLFQTYDQLLMVGGSGLYIDAVCNGMDDFPQADQKLRDELTQRLVSEGIESLRFELKRLDPKSYHTIDIKNPQRVVRALEVSLQTGQPFSSFKSHRPKERPFKIVKEGLIRERSQLYSRIDARVELMMERGLLEEAYTLIPFRDKTALQTVGYRELFGYFDGKYSLQKAVSMIKVNTRHYAKRQCSWWRRDKDIMWIRLER